MSRHDPCHATAGKLLESHGYKELEASDEMDAIDVLRDDRASLQQPWINAL